MSDRDKQIEIWNKNRLLYGEFKIKYKKKNYNWTFHYSTWTKDDLNRLYLFAKDHIQYMILSYIEDDYAIGFMKTHTIYLNRVMTKIAGESYNTNMLHIHKTLYPENLYIDYLKTKIVLFEFNK